MIFILIFVLFVPIIYLLKYSIFALKRTKIKEITVKEKINAINFIQKYYNDLKSSDISLQDIFLYNTFGFRMIHLYYSYKNEKNIYLSVLISNINIIIISFNTWFDGNISLTTTDYISAGNIPKLDNYYLQIYESEDLNIMFKKHQDAILYLISEFNYKPISFAMDDSNITTSNLKQSNLRKYFLIDQFKLYNKIGYFPFIKILFKYYNENSKQYLNDLEFQL